MIAEHHANSLAAEAHRRRQHGTHASFHLRAAQEPVFIAGGTTAASDAGQNSPAASPAGAATADPLRAAGEPVFVADGTTAASRAGQNSLAASLAGAATTDEGVLAREGATAAGGMGAFPDGALFNQAVKKLDEAVSHLPTVAVVKF